MNRQIAAIVCLALFLTLQVFAASNSLHKIIHRDAGTPGHQCVLTVIAQGQVNAPAAGPGVAVLVAALLFCLSSPIAAVFSSVDYRLSPSRAPPRF